MVVASAILVFCFSTCFRVVVYTCWDEYQTKTCKLPWTYYPSCTCVEWYCCWCLKPFHIDLYFDGKLWQWHQQNWHHRWHWINECKYGDILIWYKALKLFNMFNVVFILSSTLHRSFKCDLWSNAKALDVYTHVRD